MAAPGLDGMGMVEAEEGRHCSDCVRVEGCKVRSLTRQYLKAQQDYIQKHTGIGCHLDADDWVCMAFKGRSE